MTGESSASGPDIAPRRSIIAVASGKGGVGKTWFAITLSHALAKRNREVLLFDGDLGLANVDIQLGLMPKHDLGAVMEGRTTLQGATTKYEGGFDIIAGRSGSAALSSLPPAQLSELRTELVQYANRYDQVVVDLGAGVDRTVRLLSQLAGTILVVTNDEPTSITDAYAYIKMTLAANPATDVRIVVNMAANVAEGERTFRTLSEACNSFLKVQPPLAGIIRRDGRVREAIRTQTSLYLKFPGSDAAMDVDAIAARLLGAG